MTPDGKFRSISLAEVVDHAKPKTQLMISAPKGSTLQTQLGNLQKQENHQSGSPTGLWDRFIKDDALSTKAKENFGGATVLRLLEVRERGEKERLSPIPLRKKFDLKEISEGGIGSFKVYGYELQAGRLYDFQLAYSRLTPNGQEGDLLDASYEFASPIDDFDIARSRIPITGNYRFENVWIKPKGGKPAPTSLDWLGTSTMRENATSTVSKSNEKLIGLFVPVMSQGKFWTQERIIYVVSAAIFGLMALLSFWKAYELGSVPPQPNQPPSPLITISTAIGAFCAGTAGSFLQSLAKAFIEDKKPS